MSKRILCLYGFWLVVMTARAQGSADALIHFKQRVLKRPQPELMQQQSDSDRLLHLMIAGNIYQTEKHIQDAYDMSTGSYNFRDELKYIQPILSIGDIAVANLKTSFANDPQNMFSSPDEFALAVKYSGINAVLHANLLTAHIDRSAFNRTRDLMNEFDIRYTGAFADKFQRLGNYPLIIDKKGFRIAILNYCDMEEQPDISDNFYINKIDRQQIEQDLRLAKANKPDFTIIYFDWGAESQDIPTYRQMDLTRFCFERGADLIVGTLPNAPMRLDFVNYYRDGEYKEGIVAYSLGNLIASNEDVNNRNGYLMDMELTKNNYTGKVGIGDWGVIPVYTYYDTLAIAGQTKVYSVPCSAVEAGDIMTGLPYIEKRRVINGAYKVRQLLGATADEIQYNLTESVANNVMETIDLTKAAWNNPYNQKRPEKIPPSVAPVATLTPNGNNPPSLQKIYGSESAKQQGPDTALTATRKPGKFETEKAEAEKLFAPDEASKISGADNRDTAAAALLTTKGTTAAIAPPATPANAETDTAIKATSTISREPKAEGGKVNATSTDTLPAITEEAAKKQPVARTDKAPAVVVNRTSQDAEEDSTALRKTGTAQKATPPGKPAPANGHTTGNPSQVQKPDYGTRQHNQTTVENKQPEKQPEIIIGTQATENIKANSESKITGDMKPVKGKDLKLVVDTFYRIQFYAMKKYVPLDTNYYTHLKGFEVIEENGMFKYLLGKYKNYQDCYKFWKSQMQPRYKESFIVKYIDGKRVLE